MKVLFVHDSWGTLRWRSCNKLDALFAPVSKGLAERIYFAGYPENGGSGEKLVYSYGTKNPRIHRLLHVPSNPLLQGSSGGAWFVYRGSKVKVS